MVGFYAEYELEVPGSKWTEPPDVPENDRDKILSYIQIQRDKIVVATQPDILAVDKQDEKEAEVDVT